MSQTIIDSLIVKFGIDNTGAKQKASDIDRDLKGLEKSADKAESGFKDLTRSIGAFLAVLGGTAALKSFITQTIESNAALDRLSRNLNLSVETISAWGNAVEEIGGSAKGLQGTLDMLSKSQTELRLTGQSSLIPYFSALGLSLADVEGRAKPVDEILLDLADRFSHMDRTTANNMGKMMGIDQDTLNLLLQGRKELETTIRRQKEHNAVTKQQAEEAVILQKRIADLKQGFRAFGRDLLQQAAPVLEKILGYLQSVADWVRDNKEFISDFFKILAVGFAAVAIAALPISGTIALIVGLGAAIALLWQDYQTWKRGGDSFIDWGKWEPGIEAAIHGINRLRLAVWFAIQGLKEIAAIKRLDWLGLKDLTNQTPPSLNQLNKDAFSQGATGLFKRDTVNGTKYFADFFKKQGWSDAQSAGIVANILSESGGFQTATGDNGKAFGLAQWHPDRQAAFKQFAGHDIRFSTLDEQLGFIQYELTHGEKGAGDALRNATTAEEAGSIISKRYERPADVEGQASKRGALAATLAGVKGASSQLSGAGDGSKPSVVDDHSVETHIGEVKIYTAAIDADGIARDMGKSMDYLFASQANTGLY
jgi:hypothetical protein